MTTMQRPPTGPQATATRAEIRRELGDLDERVLERLVALGPTVEHLRAARDQHPSVDPSDTEALFEAVRDAVATSED